MAPAIRESGLADRVALTELLDAVMPEWVDLLAPGGSGPVVFLAAPRLAGATGNT